MLDIGAWKWLEDKEPVSSGNILQFCGLALGAPGAAPCCVNRASKECWLIRKLCRFMVRGWLAPLCIVWAALQHYMTECLGERFPMIYNQSIVNYFHKSTGYRLWSLLIGGTFPATQWAFLGEWNPIKLPIILGYPQCQEYVWH